MLNLSLPTVCTADDYSHPLQYVNLYDNRKAAVATEAVNRCKTSGVWKKHALCMMWVKLKTWFIHWVQDDTKICLNDHLWYLIVKQLKIDFARSPIIIGEVFTRKMGQYHQYSKTLNNVFEFCNIYPRNHCTCIMFAHPIQSHYTFDTVAWL